MTSIVAALLWFTLYLSTVVGFLVPIQESVTMCKSHEKDFNGCAVLPRFPKLHLQGARSRLISHAVKRREEGTRLNQKGNDSEEPSMDFFNVESQLRRHLLQSILASTTVGVVTSSPDPSIAMDTSLASSTSSLLAAAVATAEVIKILKPPMDNRNYESYTLDNGMRVLLVSDPETSTMAAGVHVHVGAMSDPDEVPGLAHFNEHMLFLGTKDYPDEAGFETFLSKNSGSSNAFTGSEETVYYFDMSSNADVKQGLSRFGSFFTSPLFTEGATNRELNAIESENAKNLQSDIFRFYQIEKGRGNKNHPFSKFFTGNKSTLLDETKKQNIDLRQELLKFYEKYYSSNQMYLAVISSQSLPTLKNYVNDAFSKVPNRNVGVPEASWLGVQPFTSDIKQSAIPSLGYKLEIVPVQDLRSISFAFPIIYESKSEFDDILLLKPDDYVGHLLGHEGPGSLLSYLKREGWANGVGSSSDNESSDFETFVVSVELTNKGLTALDQVSSAVFSYINMLQNDDIPSNTFEEVLRLSELNWRFLSKGEPSGYVQSLVSAMEKYEPSLYVAGPRRIALRGVDSGLLNSSKPRDSFSSSAEIDMTKDAVKKFVAKLRPSNTMVTVVSKSFQGKTKLKEKWYDTAYNVEAIPSAVLREWETPPKAGKLGFNYPKPNVFIPSENELKVLKPPPKTSNVPKTFEDRMKPIAAPKIIRDDGENGKWTVFFKQDDQFGQPKAFVIFELLNSTPYSSPKNAALATLYELCASDSLNEYTYDANLAGLGYTFTVLPRGVRLTFGGYSSKIPDFAAYVSRKLAADVRDVLPKNAAEFDRYKDTIMRALASFDVKQPYAHAIYYSNLSLTPTKFSYTNAELRESLSSCTLSDLTAYVQNVWSSGKGEALVQGNFDEKEALALVNSLDNALGFRAIPPEQYPPRLKALPFPLGQPTQFRMPEINASNNNAAVQVLFQSLGNSEKDHMLIELLTAIIEEPFYNELRTKQQLGYIVASGVKAVEETRCLSLIVQSSVFPAKNLTEAIFKFFDSFRSIRLEKITKLELSLIVKGLLDRKLQPDKQLSVQATRNWSEITNGRFRFDRVQREASALLDITKEDILNFWDTTLAADAIGGRRVFISEVIPRTGVASSTAPVKSTGYASNVKKGNNQESTRNSLGGLALGVDDIEQFRRSREEKMKTIA